MATYTYTIEFKDKEKIRDIIHGAEREVVNDNTLYLWSPPVHGKPQNLGTYDLSVIDKYSRKPE